MASFDTAEVEEAFRTYWKTGAVGEDWDAWADLFTEDAQYVEHYLGDLSGREEIRAWIKPIMADFAELYTVYEWHICSPDGRVVVYMQNRRDHPDPPTPPIDFPGITVLQYAGGGKFSREEDFWAVRTALATADEYARACERSDPAHRAKRTRRDWGDGPAWTRGAPTYFESVGGRKLAPSR